MPNSPLWPRAPRIRRAAGLALVAIVAVLGVTVRIVTPTHAAAEPVVVAAPPAPTPTIAPALAALPAPTPPAPVARTPINEAAVADPVITGLYIPPARPAPQSVTTAGSTSGSPSVSASDDDPLARAEAIFAAVVPARWRAAVPARFTIVGGNTSMSYTDGEIELARSHLDRSDAMARSTIAHEWGHQAAYRFGTRAFLGAGPSGFPYGGPRPEEAWADCVAEALTGVVIPSHGLPPCPGESRAFTEAWLAVGP